MCYKKFLSMLALTTILLSCQKDPDWEEMDNEYVVYTQRDESFDANEHQYYFIPDSILIIGNFGEAIYMNGRDAENIIATVAQNMNNAGYTRVDNKEEADLGIQLSYVSNTSYFTGYTGSPYWWWGYPGYWDPFYWGGWGYWGYGFPITYSYSENSLLGELINLNTPKGDDIKLPVVWNMYINGEASGSKFYDSNRMLRGIDQAFQQSVYLKKQN